MNVLVIAPHPDDETLGCGGTILRHKKEGDKVSCVFVTCVSTEYGFSADLVHAQKLQIDGVSHEYDFDNVFQMKYPTTYMDTIPMVKIVSDMSEIFKQMSPETVYIPNKSDVHSDHRIVFNAAFACTKTFRSKNIKKVLMYETLSETEYSPAIAASVFVPNYYVDITRYFGKKIDIMKVYYSSELAEFPFPRSVENMENLAKFRAATAGGGGGEMRRCEAFQLIKQIV
jgi:LmbE family N-acetylglucosaminyl deacetylase